MNIESSRYATGCHVKEFQTFGFDRASFIDLRDDEFPTGAAAWTPASPLHLADVGTHFGFVYSGRTELSFGSSRFVVSEGMYFAIPGTTRITGGSGLAITRLGFRGFFHLGGPIEPTGRLRYIDGCTDSLLIPPILMGDPCLNLLHIPPGTHQTTHTHPSLRVGLIVRGLGEWVMPDGRVPLKPGLSFVIPAHTLHSFHTTDSELLVIAYHPDSDFGPTHECHPMVNRTIIP